MKFFVLLGGSSGFVLSFVSSLHAGNAPAYALRDGAVGCLVGALFLRGLHFVIFASIRSHLTESAAAAQAARAEAAAKKPT